jgi:hypothetical protein
MAIARPHATAVVPSSAFEAVSMSDPPRVLPEPVPGTSGSRLRNRRNPSAIAA